MRVANRFIQTQNRVLAVAQSNKLACKSSTLCTIASTKRFQSQTNISILLNPQYITMTTKVVNAVYLAAVVTTNAPWSCTMLQCLSPMMDSLKLETMRSSNTEMRLIMLKIKEVNSKTYTKWFKI